MSAIGWKAAVKPELSCRNANQHAATILDLVVHFDVAVVKVCYALTNRKPKPELSTTLALEELVEYLISPFRWDAGAIVPNEKQMLSFVFTMMDRHHRSSVARMAYRILNEILEQLAKEIRFDCRIG